MAAKFKHMSEVVFEYVEDLDSNLTCAICRSALVDPVTTTACKHTFCRDCIEKAIAVNPSCPIDRSALNVAGLRETEQLVKLMLDELNVRCTAEGCGKVMQRGLLLSHSRTCQQAIITCPDDGCGLSMAAHRLPHHRAYECFKRTMSCTKCDVLLTFRDAQSHSSSHPEGQDSGGSTKCALCDEIISTSPSLHKWTCHAVSIACTHSSRGCPAICLRSELAFHLRTCPFEALGAFFEVNDARLKAMEDKQNALSNQVDDLKRELNRTRQASMQRQAVEQSFTGVSSSLDAAIMRQNLAMGSTSSRGSAVAPGLETGLTPSPNRATTSGLGLGTGISRYDDRSRPPAPVLGNGRNMFSPSFGSHQTFADWAFQRLADMPRGIAHGDDLVLEMRAVLLHLASALDSMERRNEVRTMTETLRVQEELALCGRLSTRCGCLTNAEVMTDRPPSRHHTRLSLRSAPPPPPPVSSQNDEGDQGSFSTANDTPFTAGTQEETSPANVASATGADVLESSTSLSGVHASSLELGQNRPNAEGLEEDASAASIIESVVFTAHDNTLNAYSDASSVSYTSGAHPDGGSPGSLGGLRYGSAQGLGTGVHSRSNAYASAIRSMSQRGALRSASIIGGTGGFVGQPMGLPSTPTLSGTGGHGVLTDQGSPTSPGVTGGRSGPMLRSSRSSSRLSRAVSSSLNSMRNAGRSAGSNSRT